MLSHCVVISLILYRDISEWLHRSTTDMEDIDEGQGDHQGAPLDAARTYDCDNLQLVVQVISHALSLRSVGVRVDNWGFLVMYTPNSPY